MEQESFELAYSPLFQNEENSDGEDDHVVGFNFQNTFTYKYITRSFQGIDPKSPAYQFKRLMRAVFTVLMLSCFIFDFTLFLQSFREDLPDLTFINRLLTIFVMVTWMLRNFVLYTIGTYLFAKHNFNLQEEIIGKLVGNRDYDATKSIITKLRTIDSKVNRIMVWMLLMFVFLPILVRFSPIVIEYFVDVDYNWKTPTEELIETFIILYTRLVPLPFYFYLVYLGYLQSLQVEECSERIKKPSYKATLDDAFHEYAVIHKGISNYSTMYKLYLKVVFVVIVTWGTLYAYFSLGHLRMLTKIDIEVPFYTFAVYDFFAELIKYALECGVLFSVLFHRLLKVEESQEDFIARILETQYSKLPKDHCLKELQNVMDLATRVEQFQKFDTPGYIVYGGRLSRIRVIWLIVLSPLILHIANSVIEGKLKETV